MGKSHPLPGFGQVDLDLPSKNGLDSPCPAPPPPEESFGHIDLEIADDSASAVSQVRGRKPIDTQPPPSVHDEATRIVKGDLLSNFVRSTPPALGGSTERSAKPTMRSSEPTRIGALDDGLLAVARGDVEIEDAPPSSRNAPSGSGVSARVGRVAAMRELYAKGEADAALALAATLDDEADEGTVPLAPEPPERGVDSPDASVCVEVVGEAAVDDPCGGPVSVDDLDDPWDTPAEEAPPERSATPSLDPALASLTLTQRQSIPRVLKSPAEVSELPLDYRSGFVLSFVDGNQTVEEILDVCAMPLSEALELMQQLAVLGVIEFD